MNKKKRVADEQLIKNEADDKDDDTEDSGNGNGNGTWAEASAEKLKARTFVSVRRKGAAATAAGGFSVFGQQPLVATSESKAGTDSKHESKESKESKESTESKSDSKDVNESPSKITEAKGDTASLTASTTSTTSTTSWGSFAAFGANSSMTSFGSLAATSLTGGGFGVTSNGFEQLAALKPSDVVDEQSGTKEIFKDAKKQSSGTESDRTIIKVANVRVYLLKNVKKRINASGVEIKKAEPTADEGKEGRSEPTTDEKKVDSADSSGGGGGSGGDSLGAGEKEIEVQQFVESGRGELYVNTFTDGTLTKSRMVLRAEKTQRLVLNAPVFAGMKFNIEGDKFIRFLSADLDGKMAVHLLKFGSKNEATEADAAIKRAIALV